MVERGLDIVLRDMNAEARACFVKADQPFLRDGSILAVYECDAPMSHLVDIVDQRGHTSDIVREHRCAIVKNKIEGNGWDFAGNQADDRRIGEVHRGNDHTVAVAIFRVLIVVH
ncbi:hypothetical protein SDC9_115078 [bioreactor metagenome]|uniref:Uncharacterized protein n=1 Tax=bioreactor metagenome TaxID=1076179 RepID=A0A645BSD7_9ZZZZ